MLDPNSKLYVFTSNGGDVNVSSDMQDFTRNDTTFNLGGAKALYFGFYKPISQVSIDLTTPNSVTNDLQVFFNNGTTWITTINPEDQTKGLTRSGAISWDRELITPVEVELFGITAYWYRLTSLTEYADMVVNGINVLFSDDQDLAEQVPEINDAAHLAGKASHVLAHVAARNWVVQDLRNKNYGKRDSDGILQDITAWDLLIIDQINVAATFKALSIIYFNYSDEVNDIYSTKSKSYLKQAKDTMQLARLALDSDDDGELDTNENIEEYKTRRVTR